MQETNQDEDPMARVVSLAPDCDPTKLSLTAAEGFLLSRIDGSTPWRLLREMGGVSASEADACLTQWLESGVVRVIAPASQSTSGGSSSSEAQNAKSSSGSEAKSPPLETDAATVEDFPAPVIDETCLDDALEIDLDVQRRILMFEASLGHPYHVLLGVVPGADVKVVKRAYFKLSKEFHPDRYFRKEIGSYGARLERIFKKVLEAHEILSDPELCQVENHTPAVAAPVAETPAEPEQAPIVEPKVDPAAPKTLTKLELLRQRMPFKIDHQKIAARRAKAEDIFRAAELSLRHDRLKEAEASIKIAICFDPSRAEFKEALGALRIQKAGAKATKLLAKPSDRMSDTEMREARVLIEDVLIYRPHDPELNDRAARICMRLEKFDEALDYAETLIERCPEVAAHHSLLGQIYRALDRNDDATREFEIALKCDKDDVDARRGIAALRIGHRDAVRGGQA